jgi:hypothetical protein
MAAGLWPCTTGWPVFENCGWSGLKPEIVVLSPSSITVPAASLHLASKLQKIQCAYFALISVCWCFVLIYARLCTTDWPVFVIYLYRICILHFMWTL